MAGLTALNPCCLGGYLEELLRRLVIYKSFVSAYQQPRIALDQAFDCMCFLSY